MITNPAFKANLHVVVLPGEGVLLLSEDGAKALYGAGYEKIAPLADGRRSADDIVDALAGEVDAARVYYVLGELEAKGWLAEASSGIAGGEAAFWESAGVAPAAAVAALATKRAKVAGVGEVDPVPLQTALKAAGVRLTPDDDADLGVVAADDYLRPALASINAAALASGKPWLLMRAGGREQWLGPLFIPGETGCWECLRRRLSRLRDPGDEGARASRAARRPGLFHQRRRTPPRRAGDNLQTL